MTIYKDLQRTTNFFYELVGSDIDEYNVDEVASSLL